MSWEKFVMLLEEQDTISLTRSDLWYCDIDGERVETEGIQDLKKHLAESRTARGVHTFSVDDGDMIRE
jgi:hypothetical protein